MTNRPTWKMINLRDLASYDFGKVPFEKNIIC